MMNAFKALPFIFLVLTGFAASSAKAEDEIVITDFMAPGDGKTQTFLQFLDTQGIQSQELKHAASATPKGDMSYSYQLELPTAILAPSLGLGNSSEGRDDREMPYGWSLSGIPQITRPLVSAYVTKEKSEWYDAEWIVSAPGFSGTLIPSGLKDWRFFLKTASPSYVVADYDSGANTWSVKSGGLVMTLSAEDDGASSSSGTALWRATEIKDPNGNYITYCYDDDGLIDRISYGGNKETGEAHLVTIAFAYAENAVTRTSARSGFLTKFAKHVDKITVQSGENDSCSTGSGTSTKTDGIFGATTILNSGVADALKTSSTSKLATGAKSVISAKGKASSVVSTSSKVTKGAKSGLVAGSVKGTAGLVLAAVDTDDAEDSENRLYAFDLITTATDSLDFLVKIEREGSTSRDAEVIAEFEYSEFDDDDTAARTSTAAPASLGESRFEDDDSVDPYAETTKSLMDFNRDGLADVIDASASDVAATETWQIDSQEVDYDDRSFSWNGAQSVDSLGKTLSYALTVDDDDPSGGLPYNPAYTSREVMDLDGDGYLDVVESGNASKWTVYYGTGKVSGVYSMMGSHNYFSAVEESPPSAADWTYSQESWRLKADHADAESVTTDVRFGFIDLNGDGWMDLIRPEDNTVWLKTTTRGGGWTKEVRLSNRFEALRSVDYTLDASTFSIDMSDFCDHYMEIAVLQSPTGDMACANTVSGCGGSDVRQKQCESAFQNTVQHQIVYTDEYGAFYDMNGDGLTDYVYSRSTPWRVYLNTGSDIGTNASDGNYASWPAPAKYTRRVDEGTPYKDWEDKNVGYSKSGDGSPTKVYQTLIDVDGDGLLDLAMGSGGDINGNGRTDEDEMSSQNVWYKNTGAGFETSSRTLPGWWPSEFMASWSTTNVINDEAQASGATTTSGMMVDLDHDGAVDYVSVAWHHDSDGESDAGENLISYGPYPRPYLVTGIKNGQGGQTTVSYRSLATVSPSGDWSEKQKTPNVRHLVDVIYSVDGYTGQRGETDFEYENGEYEDGVFLGFTGRTVSHSLNGKWTDKTVYEYDLDADFQPIATATELYTDFNLSFGSKLSKGAAKEGLRFEMENSYGDYGAARQFHLIGSRTITEYGESSGSKSYAATFDWDDYGNLKTFSHNGGGDGDDALIVTMSYVADNANPYDATFYRMSRKSIYGYDPLGGTKRDFTDEKYYYDGHGDVSAILDKGLFTRVSTGSGWVDGGESLTDSTLAIDYERGDRGELKSVLDESTGIRLDQTFGFGGAVLLTQTNGMGQKLTRTIDGQGRITSVQDDNGLTIASTYDAFNRVIKKEVTGTDGTKRTLETNSYSRITAPFYTKNETYDDSGSVEETGYALEDGFGNTVQDWRQDEDGHFRVTTNIHDMLGRLVKNSHPDDKGTSFSLPMTSIGVSDALGTSYYDALGVTREFVRDATKATGSQLIALNSPRKEIMQDESGYQTKLSFDAFQRVTKVEEGKSDSFVTTATYRYDPLNRLVKFRDGNGVCYAYSYDGAGRLRQVKYGGTKGSNSAAGKLSVSLKPSSAATASCDAPTTWYTYEYQGALKTKMTDRAGGITIWENDTIGRAVKITVTDPLPSSTGFLTYEFDYDDSWVGKVYKTTDPSGETLYSYDAFGRESNVDRTYLASATGTLAPSFSYTNDLHGRMTDVEFPSGRSLDFTYKYGHLIRQTASTAGVNDYALTYDYNKWGLISSVNSSSGHEFSHEFTTPLWPDAYQLKYGATAYVRSYEWYDNGLLKQREDSSGSSDSSTTGLSGKAIASVLKTGSSAKAATTTSKSTLTASTASKLTSGSGKASAGVKASAVTAAVSDGSAAYTYSYDDLKELSAIKNSFKTLESYSYDSAGNLKTMKDSSGATWTYATPSTLNQISGRTSDKGGSDAYTYDQAGRVATWKDSSGTRTFYYDGLGRLRGVELNGVWQMILDYDVDGNLMRRGDNNPYTGTPYYTYKFRTWRYDEKTKTTTEEDGNFVTTETADDLTVTRNWLFRDYDGHAFMTFSDDGTQKSSRKLGGYGAVISSTGAPSELYSFAGVEDQGDLFLMGQRHLMQKDGTWLQPEPLLYLGIPTKNLTAPLGLAILRYAKNSPTLFSDVSGFDPTSYIVENVNVVNSTSMDIETPVQTLVSMVQSQDVDLQGWDVQWDFLIDTVKDINPQGGTLNCVSTAIATDLTLGGTPTSAGDIDASGDVITGADKYEIADYFATELGVTLEFTNMGGNLDSIQNTMESLGPGARGIVIGYNSEAGTSHAFNVVYDGEKVTYLDGQSGDTAVTYTYDDFDLAITDEGEMTGGTAP